MHAKTLGVLIGWAEYGIKMVTWKKSVGFLTESGFCNFCKSELALSDN